MTGRLAAAAAALVTAAALVAWGLAAGPSGTRAARTAAAPAVRHSVAGGTASAAAPGLPPGWRLAFDGRFPGARLDTSVWATCYPWMDEPSGCTNFGNTEYQWYLPSQDRVSGGVLHLIAEREPTAGASARGAPKTYLCRSGMVTTYPAFRFMYGYVQVVAKIAARPGLWSGLWLAAADERWPPEIDILEHWGTSSGISGLYLHPLGGDLLRKHVQVPGLASGWHTFAVDWAPGALTWYIDGRAVLTTHVAIPHQPMYFIADLAEYQPASAGTCAGELQVRSVMVWQPS
jgi:beta-glucanase (GH16 family)